MPLGRYGMTVDARRSLLVPGQGTRARESGSRAAPPSSRRAPLGGRVYETNYDATPGLRTMIAERRSRILRHHADSRCSAAAPSAGDDGPTRDRQPPAGAGDVRHARRAGPRLPDGSASRSRRTMSDRGRRRRGCRRAFDQGRCERRRRAVSAAEDRGFLRRRAGRAARGPMPTACRRSCGKPRCIGPARDPGRPGRCTRISIAACRARASRARIAGGIGAADAGAGVPGHFRRGVVRRGAANEGDRHQGRARRAAAGAAARDRPAGR